MRLRVYADSGEKLAEVDLLTDRPGGKRALGLADRLVFIFDDPGGKLGQRDPMFVEGRLERAP